MSRAVPRFKRVNPPLPVLTAGQSVVSYKIIGSIEGQLTVTGFSYYANTSFPTPGQMTILLSSLSTNLLTPYRNCVSIDWSLTSERLDVVNLNNIAGITSTAHAGTLGARATGHLPTEVAATILRQSGVKGQHGRGRISLPAIAEADVTNSTITSAALILALGNLGTAMLTTGSDGTNTWTPVITQRAATSPKLVVGAAILTAVNPKLLLGTVRRRKIGRGK